MNWAALGADAQTYVALSISALAAGIAAGVPLGVVASHVAPLRGPVLAIANLARVIPSLALLTFMLPLFGLGFLPAFVALAVLAAAPVAITADVAYRGVPPAAADAARGLGMTPVQVLLRVETPLALGVLFAGVRTAATEVIASAVLASFVGAGGLGEEITSGLQGNDPGLLWSGVASIALIALTAEYALAAVARRYSEVRA
jgi:osmoprotectant transport system permease protein